MPAPDPITEQLLSVGWATPAEWGLVAAAGWLLLWMVVALGGWERRRVLIVLFGAVYSAIVLAHIEKQDPNEMNVWVVGQQYKWSFAYTAPDGATPDAGRLLLGRVVRVKPPR